MRDEDSPVFPEAWHRELYPRRGGVAGPKIVPHEDAVAWGRATRDQARPHLDAALAHPDSDPVLVEALRRALDGAADPLGAAVAALCLRDRGVQLERTSWERVVDGWVAEHGLPFAAHACAETFRVWGARDVSRVLALRFIAPGENVSFFWGLEHGAARVRALLAVADEEQYRQAVERLARCRTHPAQRVAVSFLVPGRRDWVDECCADPPQDPLLKPLLWCALETADQIAALGPWARLDWQECRPSVLGAFVDGAGAAAVPVLAAAADRLSPADLRHRVLDALAMVPCAEAIEALLDRLDLPYTCRALQDAVRRYPVRAVRLLAPRAAAAPDDAVTDILLAHLREHPRLLAEVRPGASEEARAACDALAARLARVPEAAAEDLPGLVVNPPWRSDGEKRRPRGGPAPVSGLTPPAGRQVVWKPGEREAWMTTGGTHVSLAPGDPGRLLRAGAEAEITPTVLLHSPPEMAGPVLRDWAPVDYDRWKFSDWAKSLVARFGTDALPIALSVAELSPRFLDVLLPLRNADVAQMMADLLARQWRARRTVLEWFARHGTAAVPLLVPDALEGPDRRRTAAETALRHLAARHGAAEVAAAARVHGEAAAEAVRALLEADPLDTLTVRPPHIGDWADPSVLPQVLLRDRRRALPEPAVGNLIAMLAMGRPRNPCPGIARVRAACDPRSLARFGWALMHRWAASGAATKHRWALQQLAWTGDEETACRLPEMICRWPELGHRAAALHGIAVLGELGTPEALAQLRRLEHRAPNAALRRAAGENAAEVAERLGIDPAEEEPPPPGLGLAPDGTLVLDYGPRRFTVAFDAQLLAQVIDETGRHRRSLPKPTADDDPGLAAEAKRRLAALRKEATRLVTTHIARLEKAVRTGRRWSAAEFAVSLEHPLLWRIAHGLVWIAEPPLGGGEPVAFRVAEDRSLADVFDERYVLPPNARVGVAHPLELGTSLKAWRETFEDYRILQPFPQLHRTVHTLTDAERTTGVLDRSRLGSATGVNVTKLQARGWDKNHAEEGHVIRHIPGGHLLILDACALRARHIDLNTHPISGIHPGFAPMDPLTETRLIEDLLDAVDD